MRRIQKIILALSPVLALLLFADPALAVTYGGTGLFGNTNDVVISNAMFFLLGFFPVIIIIFSAFQMWTEHRRHKKLEAQRTARAAEPERSGW